MSPMLFEIAGDKLENTYIYDKMYIGYEGAKWQTLVEAYQADHDGQEERRGRRVAHKAANDDGGDHHYQEQLRRAGIDPFQERLPDIVGHAGVGQGLHQN